MTQLFFVTRLSKTIVSKGPRELPEPAQAAHREHPVLQRPRRAHRAHRRPELREEPAREVLRRRQDQRPDLPRVRRPLRFHAEEPERPRPAHRGVQAAPQDLGRAHAQLSPVQQQAQLAAHHDPGGHQLRRPGARRRQAPQAGARDPVLPRPQDRPVPRLLHGDGRRPPRHHAQARPRRGVLPHPAQPGEHRQVCPAYIVFPRFVPNPRASAGSSGSTTRRGTTGSTSRSSTC